MNDADIPKLNDEQQKWFEAAIERRLKDRHLTRADVAQAFPGVERPGGKVDEKAKSKGKSYITRFLKGEPTMVRRWLRKERDEWLVPFAEQLDWPPEKIEALMAQAARGALTDAGAGWHSLFPGLTLDEVAILSRLSMCDQQQGDALVKQVRSHLFRKQTDKHAWLWIVGRPGTGRRTMGRVLANLVPQQQGDSAEVKLLLEEPAEGWFEEITPGGTPVIAVAPQVPWEKSPDEMDGQETTVLPWDHVEAETLARRLRSVGAVDDHQLENCLELCRRIEVAPWFLGADQRPETVIAALARVVHRGVPGTPGQLRDWVLEDAWTRAVERAPALGLLDQQLMGRFWSQHMLTQARPLSFRLEQQGALALLKEVLAQTPRDESLERSWEPCLQRLLDAKGKKRGEEAKALQAVLLLEEPPVLLNAMINGGLLRKVGGFVEAADATHARVWCARGLAERRTLGLDERPELLLERGWHWLMVEIGIAGMPPEVVTDQLNAIPLWGAIEVAQSWIMYAAPLGKGLLQRIPEDIFRDAWHGSLWSWLFDVPEPYQPRPWGRDKKLLTAALRTVSERFNGVLPDFESDNLVEELEGRATEAIRVLSMPGRKVLSQIQNGEDLKQLTREAVSVAPAQWLPWTRGRLDWWRPNLTLAWRLLEERAGRGDRRARAMLTGEDLKPSWVGSFGDEWERHPEHAVPLDLRLEWIGQAGKRDTMAFWLLWKVIHAQGWPKQGDDEGPLAWKPDETTVDLMVSALQQFPHKTKAVEEVLERSLLVSNQLRVLDSDPMPPPALTPPVLESLLARGERRLPNALPVDRVLEIYNNEKPPTEAEMVAQDWFTLGEIAPSLAMALAIKLQLSGPLLTAVRSFEAWRADLGAGLLGREVVLRDRSGTTELRWKAPTDDESFPWSLFQRFDGVAEQAALALCGLGEPGPLRERWNHGYGPNIPEKLADDLQWIELLRRARGCPFEVLTKAKPPMNEIKDALSDRPDRQASSHEGLDSHWQVSHHLRLQKQGLLGLPGDDVLKRWHRRLETFKQILRKQPWRKSRAALPLQAAWFGLWQGIGPRATGIGRDPAELSITQKELDAELAQTLELVVALDDQTLDPPMNSAAWQTSLYIMMLEQECLQTPEPQVLSWLQRVLGAQTALGAQVQAPLDRIRERIASRSSELLLGGGDDTPLRDWLSALPRDEADFHLPPRLQDLDAPITENPKLQDRLWRLCADDTDRRVLFRRLIPMIHGQDGLRPWMFRQVQSKETSEYSRFLFLREAHLDSRSEDLLRELVRACDHVRTRAFYAYRLHRHSRWDHDVICALLAWLDEDPDPLSGGTRFQLCSSDSSQFSITESKPLQMRGGSLHLLKLLLFWPDLEQFRGRVLPGVQKLFWNEMKHIPDYGDRHATLSIFRESPDLDEPEQPRDILETLAALLEKLDDRETLQRVFHGSFDESPLTVDGDELPPPREDGGRPSGEELAELKKERTSKYCDVLTPWRLRTFPDEANLETYRGLKLDSGWFMAREGLSDNQFLELLHDANDDVAIRAAYELLHRSQEQDDPRRRSVVSLAEGRWSLEEPLTWFAEWYLPPHNPWVHLLWEADPEACLARVHPYLQHHPEDKDRMARTLSTLAAEDGANSTSAWVMVRQLQVEESH